MPKRRIGIELPKEEKSKPVSQIHRHFVRINALQSEEMRQALRELQPPMRASVIRKALRETTRYFTWKLLAEVFGVQEK